MFAASHAEMSVLLFWVAFFSLAHIFLKLLLSVSFPVFAKIDSAAGKLVSSMHASISCFLCFWALCKYGMILCSRPEMLHTLALQFSFGYFIYDFVLSVWRVELDMVVHHAAALSGLYYAIHTNISAAEICHCLFLTELSTPFLHARHYLINLVKIYKKQKVKKRHTSYVKNTQKEIIDKLESYRDIVSLLFVIVFFVARFGFGSYLLLKILKSKETSHVLKWGGSVILAISAVWGTKILHSAKKHYTKKHSINTMQ